MFSFRQLLILALLVLAGCSDNPTTPHSSSAAATAKPPEAMLLAQRLVKCRAGMNYEEVVQISVP
jgi:hypothetical protein